MERSLIKPGDIVVHKSHQFPMTLAQQRGQLGYCKFFSYRKAKGGGNVYILHNKAYPICDLEPSDETLEDRFLKKRQEFTGQAGQNGKHISLEERLKYCEQVTDLYCAGFNFEEIDYQLNIPFGRSYAYFTQVASVYKARNRIKPYAKKLKKQLKNALQ